MPVRRSGRRLHPEPPRADELPAGVPAPARQVEPGGRTADGRLVPGTRTAEEMASLGGRARAEQLRLARLLGRAQLPEGHALLPYRRDAEDWRDAELQRLAQSVGGGEVGPAVQAIVSTAALQHAASRWLFDRSALEADAKLALAASRLGDAARQNMLAATEIAAREAAAKRTAPRTPAAITPSVLRQLVAEGWIEAPAPPPPPTPTTSPSTSTPPPEDTER